MERRGFISALGLGGAALPEYTDSLIVGLGDGSCPVILGAA